MEAPGSVPGVGTEVHDRGYDRDEPVILVEAGEIFSGCRRDVYKRQTFNSEMYL